MQITRIPFQETNQFHGLFLDYCKGDKKVEEFISYPLSAASIAQLIEDRKKLPLDRNVLVTALKNQYSLYNNVKNKAVFNNIELLGNENTFTICTGHQLCLFTGPLYFIYKLLSVIKLSEELNKQYPANKFIPVYWMASEDHDFEEVNHIHLFGKKLEWKKEVDWQDSPVGELPSSSIAVLIDELKILLGENEQATHLLSLFRKAYTENKNLASATRYLVNELLGKYGLVILDGSDESLKKNLQELMKDDIFNHTNFKKVNESISRLESKGYKAQVNPREINFFYIENGKRGRIEKKADRFHVLGTEKSFSAKEMEAEIENHPGSFSPNVVTRPLYQQLILPNLAYLGGPNELSYWFEYKSMFDQHNILFPLLVPRNCAMLVDASASEKLSKFNIRPSELFTETEQLLKNFISIEAGADIEFKKEEEELRSIYGCISAKIKKTDTTLQAQAEAELQKQVHFLATLTTKLVRAEKQKQEVSVNQIRKIKEKLFPAGDLQERYDNFISFYLQHGEKLFDILKDSFQGIPKELIIIEL